MHVELCLCRVLIHDYKGTSFHGIYLSNLQKISCIILRNLSGLSLFFHQSCATGTLLLRKKNYPRRYSLNQRQLIIFMFLHGWFFISYQTQIFACDPSRINWTATGAFPGGFADDDDEYSAEGLTGRVARSSAVTPRKQEATGVFPGGFADDDDEYPEEGLTGRVARSSAVTPRKQDGDGQRGASR